MSSLVSPPAGSGTEADIPCRIIGHGGIHAAGNCGNTGQIQTYRAQFLIGYTVFARCGSEGHIPQITGFRQDIVTAIIETIGAVACKSNGSHGGPSPKALERSK